MSTTTYTVPNPNQSVTVEIRSNGAKPLEALLLSEVGAGEVERRKTKSGGGTVITWSFIPRLDQANVLFANVRHANQAGKNSFALKIEQNGVPLVSSGRNPRNVETIKLSETVHGADVDFVFIS